MWPFFSNPRTRESHSRTSEHRAEPALLAGAVLTPTHRCPRAVRVHRVYSHARGTGARSPKSGVCATEDLGLCVGRHGTRLPLTSGRLAPVSRDASGRVAHASVFLRSLCRAVTVSGLDVRQHRR